MPICPYCQGKVTLEEERHDPTSSKDIPKEVKREVKGFFSREVIYSCPHCDHILGIGTYFVG